MRRIIPTSSMRLLTTRCLVVSLLLTVLACRMQGQVPASPKWVGTWAASQQIPEPQNSLPSADLTDVTLREAVHVSIGGTTIRVRLSNAFGMRTLHITSVHIARPLSSGSSEIDPASDHILLFNGQPEVAIPPAAEYTSDPISYPLAALSDIAVSMHIEAEPDQQTGHPGSRQTTYYAHGDLTAAPTIVAAMKIDHWYMLSGIDVQASPGSYAIVALGDSITDGHATTTNGNDRWTDILARRLNAAPGSNGVGILNEGIGGNHLLIDGLGPNALARFDRDVLAQIGVRYLIVLEGINDLGGLARTSGTTQDDHARLVRNLLGAYKQIVALAHAHGITAFGATITPDFDSDYYHPGAADEADRQAVNQWIKTPGNFDAVIDFDQVVRDPRRPERLLPVFDSGDHLHPSVAGYKAMAESIPLTLFRSSSLPDKSGAHAPHSKR